MKRTENEFPADAGMAELDRELAMMAEEVPPMPAGFHEKWMDAVRAEAEAKKQDSGSAERAGRLVSLTRGPWFRGLSVAAVFVFLIGGTFLYRSQKGSIAPAVRIEENAAIPAAQEPEAAEDAGAPMAGAFEAEEAAVTAGEAYDAMEAAGEADYAMEAAEEAAPEAAAAYSAEEASPLAAKAAGGMKAGVMENNAAMVGAAEASHQAAAATAVPAAATAVPVAAETAAEAPAPAVDNSFAGFMADMGRFLLAAAPYLAAVIVGAALTAVLLKKRKAGK